MHGGSRVTDLPPKAPVVGTPISLTSYDDVLRLIEDRPRDRPVSVAVCNVHSVMSSRRSPQLAAALRDADVATPDGMPLVWTLRATVEPSQSRVYGPDLMRAALSHGVSLGWKHYFCGATDETLEQLTAVAQRMAPGVRVVGRHAPPFRPLSSTEEAQLVGDILDSGADIVWVGLGMPKQELLIHRLHRQGGLPGVVLVGVGAAFDLISGRVPQAPVWLQARGLEWAYRLWQEPRRLWRRYALNNPGFAVLMVRQVIAHRLGRSRRRV